MFGTIQGITQGLFRPFLIMFLVDELGASGEMRGDEGGDSEDRGDDNPACHRKH